MASKSTIITHSKNTSRNYLFSKLLVFRIAKYSIMVVSFTIMYLLIKDTTVPSETVGWLSLGWDWMLLVIFSWSAWNVSKLVLDSLNKSRLDILYVVGLLAFGLFLYLEESGRDIQSTNDYIRLIYFAPFPLGITIFQHGLSIFTNRRVSPLVSRNELYKFIAAICLTASLTMIYALLFLAYISKTHNFQYDGKYEMILFTISPFTVATALVFQSIAYIKNQKLDFKGWNKDKVKIVFIPLFIAVALWFYNETFLLNSSSEVVTYYLIVLGTGALMILYSIFAKGEIASSNVATTIYGTGLLIVWVMPFIYVSSYGYLYNMYTLINFSAIATSIIFISMAISDSSLTRTQSYAFAGVVLMLAATLFGYWFIQSFDFDPSTLPMDLDTMLLITFAMVPTGFLQTGMWKIFIRHTSLGHWIKVEQKIKKKEEKEGETNG